MIKSSDIAKLRAQTGAGVMDCKKALKESRGDFEKAKEILAKNAQVISKKKAARITKQGLIESYVHMGKIGVLIEVTCESDFVAKNKDFREMVHFLAMQIASMSPQDVKELLDQEFIMAPNTKVKDYIKSNILKFGENIQVKRFVRFELGEE